MVTHGGRKNKGSSAERELLHMFWNAGWGACRAAGSGSTTQPCPDLLVGHGSRTIALECKSVSSNKKYFSLKEIEELVEFCSCFGAEGWVGLRRDRKGWIFILIEDLRDTGKSFVADLDVIDLKGLTFEELIR